MSVNIAANASKPRQEKALLRSCEPCRTAKAKCVPVADQSIKECERCLKYHKNCVFAEAQPRPKRGKQTHTRVAEVEKKLDNIYALLQANRHPETTTDNPSSRTATVPANNTSSTSNPPQAPSPSSSTGHTNTSTNTSVSSHAPPYQKDFSLADDPFSSSSTTTTSSSVFPHLTTSASASAPPSIECQASLRRRPDVIDKSILTLEEAEELLNIYRDGASADYPFIYVEPSKTLETLRWEKPFLLLSILVMASAKARGLQVLLEKELRELLASKVIVEGELSLDLLQGLCVYLAWYHFNFRPCRQQLYQLTQLAASMVVDLEISRPTKGDVGFVLHPVRACLACKIDTAVPITSALEAKRTFVGAYYLTSTISQTLRKPNSMAWTRYVEQCCLDLAEAKEAPLDEYLIYYIRIQKIAEEAGIMFGYSDWTDEARLSPERIQLSVRAFVANLQEIEKSFPPEVASMPSIMTHYHSTQTYIHEIILHLDLDQSQNPSFSTPISTQLAPPGIKLFSDTTSSSSPNFTWLNSTIRTSLLLGCLDALKSSLTYFASQPNAIMQRFTMIDLARLCYNLLLLGRLTLSGGPGFHPAILQQTADVIQYFDLFSAKFADIIHEQGGEPKRNIYWHFQRIFMNARAWFWGKIKAGENGAGQAALVATGNGRGGGGASAKGLSPLSLVNPAEEASFCAQFKGQDLGGGRELRYPPSSADEANGTVGGPLGVGSDGLPRHLAIMDIGIPGAQVVGEEGPISVDDGEGVEAGVGPQLQDGLWEEMMASWPLNMDGGMLF